MTTPKSPAVRELLAALEGMKHPPVGVSPQEREFAFKVTLKVVPAEADDTVVYERLCTAGCADAIISLGTPGAVTLNFIRKASSLEHALQVANAQLSAASDAVIRFSAQPSAT